MIELKEGTKLIKTIKETDENAIFFINSVMKCEILKEKYNINFTDDLLMYLDKILNSKHKKIIVNISVNEKPIVISTLMEAKDLLPNITWYNTIEKLYFEKGELYIKLLDLNVIYKLRIVY